MFTGETILSGASNVCCYCGKVMEFKVCNSQAGYYVGTYCCEPNTRETPYGTRKDAEKWLREFMAGDFSGARS